MATERDVEQALEKAAAAIAERALSTQERTSLIDRYKTGKGGPFERALRSIEETLRITEKERREKTAASDNADRRINDLETTIQNLPKKP